MSSNDYSLHHNHFGSIFLIRISPYPQFPPRRSWNGYVWEGVFVTPFISSTLHYLYTSLHLLLDTNIGQLTLLRTLILWCLSSSDAVKNIIQASYKQNRHEDDLNQPLSVQPWGSDGDRRRYFLIEGLDDTHFRVYRESNYMGLKRTWWTVASDIDELKQLVRQFSSYYPEIWISKYSC